MGSPPRDSAGGGDPWPSLGIVVPVYDEGAAIEASIREIARVAERYRGRALVIAVDDGSADDSGVILARLERDLGPLRVSTHERNGGYGAALRTGASQAADLGLEYVAFIDSDLTNPPEDLLTIGAVAAAGHPYVKASRFRPGGGMPGVPLRRSIVSRSGNAVGRLLFGTRVTDVTNGFRAVRTELFLGWPLQERGFAVIVEELDWALRSGVEPVEFPSVLTARRDAQRASAFTYGPRLLLDYLRYPARALRRRARRRLR